MSIIQTIPHRRENDYHEIFDLQINYPDSTLQTPSYSGTGVHFALMEGDDPFAFGEFGIYAYYQIVYYQVVIDGIIVYSNNSWMPNVPNFRPGGDADAGMRDYSVHGIGGYANSNGWIPNVDLVGDPAGPLNNGVDDGIENTFLCYADTSIDFNLPYNERIPIYGRRELVYLGKYQTVTSKRYSLDTYGAYTQYSHWLYSLKLAGPPSYTSNTIRFDSNPRNKNSNIFYSFNDFQTRYQAPYQHFAYPFSEFRLSIFESDAYFKHNTFNDLSSYDDSGNVIVSPFSGKNLTDYELSILGSYGIYNGANPSTYSNPSGDRGGNPPQLFAYDFQSNPYIFQNMAYMPQNKLVMNNDGTLKFKVYGGSIYLKRTPYFKSKFLFPGDTFGTTDSFLYNILLYRNGDPKVGTYIQAGGSTYKGVPANSIKITVRNHGYSVGDLITYDIKFGSAVSEDVPNTVPHTPSGYQGYPFNSFGRSVTQVYDKDNFLVTVRNPTNSVAEGDLIVRLNYWGYRSNIVLLVGSETGFVHQMFTSITRYLVLTAVAVSGQNQLVVDNVDNIYVGDNIFSSELFPQPIPRDPQTTITNINTETKTITMSANLIRTIPSGRPIFVVNTANADILPKGEYTINFMSFVISGDDFGGYYPYYLYPGDDCRIKLGSEENV